MSQKLFLGLGLAVGLSYCYDASFDMTLAEKYVHFSGAAYCADPRFKKSGVENWTCKACAAYPGMEATTFTSSRDTNGYVGYYPTDNEVVIAFSGTNPFDIREWIDDLDFFKTEYPYCSNCEVHEGFYNTFLAAKDSILNITNSYLTQHPTATVTCTGHSLGAALAAHCAAELSQTGLKAAFRSSYTYGMPRVGDEAFEQWYTSAVSGTFRTVHRKDPVPHLPLMSMGFHHMPYEIFYEKDYNEWKLCSFDGEDESCSDKYAVDGDVLNHLKYLDFDFTTNWIDCEL